MGMIGRPRCWDHLDGCSAADRYHGLALPSPIRDSKTRADQSLRRDGRLDHDEKVLGDFDSFTK